MFASQLMPTKFSPVKRIIKTMAMRKPVVVTFFVVVL